MGKGKELASPITPHVSNPPTQQNPQYPLHAGPGPIPPMMLTTTDPREVESLSSSSLPPFVSHPDANPYPWNNQPNIAYPFHSAISLSTGVNATSSTTTSSRDVEEIKEATLDSREAEALSSSSLGNSIETKHDDENFGASPRIVVHNDGGDSIDEPKSGMLFKSEVELIAYYKRYAKESGFRVMIQRSVRKEDGSVRYVTLGCARGGKARNRTSNVSRPRPTTKTNCKARMNVVLVDGMLSVTTVANTHNHSLSPQNSRFLQCNREVNANLKRVLDIGQVDVGGLENLPFLEKDCCNHNGNAQHLQLGKGGAQTLCEYFARMQYMNDGFFALMNFDDDSRLKNVFWADARSREAYKYFGDVVTFDMTYLTNKNGIPFAPFVGVNHHGQSIFLGACLISSEDTETFIWLFQTWLNCMDRKAPDTIITDQDGTMKNAIAIVFPNTRHRYCLWHILRKVPEELGSHSEYKCGLKSKLLQCVYDSLTIEEFENSWDVLITTYNLRENLWLQSLYIDRMFWVPIYLKNSFWAGMSTTQRSERLQSFFDGFVHARTNLKGFIDQLDNVLKKKIENENAAELHSFNVTIPCISHMQLEKRFQELYTNAKFREVQQEIMGMIYCHCNLQKQDEAISTYHVDDEVKVEELIKEVTYTVYFNEAECEAKCACGLFEMRGIMCRHILAVFSARRVRSLPEKYILDRWRKDLKRRYTLIPSSYDVADERPEVHRYRHLLNTCYEVITNASSCDEYADDMISKLYAMNEVYRTTKAHLFPMLEWQQSMQAQKEVPKKY